MTRNTEQCPSHHVDPIGTSQGTGLSREPKGPTNPSGKVPPCWLDTYAKPCPRRLLRLKTFTMSPTALDTIHVKA
ncbi:hypothetical protein ACCO45_011983 [Purpureocillium lilacinum]|uniref:Uncharacterized protein n=1 Tax=Purpureocillium lilacinum TaxID=33203 RepID=A0ACC4DD04_PURLI